MFKINIKLLIIKTTMLFFFTCIHSSLLQASTNKYSCIEKAAAAIRSNGVLVFSMTGADGVSAFNEEKPMVHFQDIFEIDDKKVSFVIAVNSSITRFLCNKII